LEQVFVEKVQKPMREKNVLGGERRGYRFEESHASQPPRLGRPAEQQYSTAVEVLGDSESKKKQAR
jgi:hypothetical protein